MSNDEAYLINLGGLVQADLDPLDDSALAHVLRRVLADPDRHDDRIAAFESSIQDFR